MALLAAATSAAAPATRTVTAGRGFGASAAAARSEDRELLGKLFGAAMRTGRAFPLAGAHQDFAVSFAFGTVKFVNRHGVTL